MAGFDDRKAILIPKSTGIGFYDGTLLYAERYIVPQISRDNMKVTPGGDAWGVSGGARNMELRRPTLPIKGVSLGFYWMNPPPNIWFGAFIDFVLTNGTDKPLTMTLDLPSDIQQFVADGSGSYVLQSDGLSGTFTAPPNGSVTATLHAKISPGGSLIGGRVYGFSFPPSRIRLNGAPIPYDLYVDAGWGFGFH